MTTDEALRDKRENICLAHMTAENAHDFDTAIGLFTRPRYDIVATGEVYDGSDELHRFMHENVTAFPDFHYDVERMHHADDAIIVEGRYRGTHEGTWRGFRALGARSTSRCSSCSRSRARTCSANGSSSTWTRACASSVSPGTRTQAWPDRHRAEPPDHDRKGLPAIPTARREVAAELRQLQPDRILKSAAGPRENSTCRLAARAGVLAFCRSSAWEAPRLWSGRHDGSGGGASVTHINSRA